ncbi:MAG: hypothetical protein AB9835_05865 [Eubacteriales bacterium]
MKRIVVMLLSMTFLLSSCLYDYEKSTDNRNLTNTIPPLISPSSIPSIKNDMTDNDSSNEITTSNPNGYYSSDVEKITGYNYDFSQLKINNSNNRIFLPYEPKDDITGSLEIYLKKTEKEIDILSDDIECDKIANEFLKSLMNKDYKHLENLTGVRSTENNEKNSMFSFLENITIDSYTIKRINEEKFTKYYSIDLFISKSDNLRYPVGKSSWIMEIPQMSDLSTITLFVRQGESGYLTSPEFYEHGKDKYLDFSVMLLDWYNPSGGYITPNEFDINKIQHSTYHLMSFFGIGINGAYTLNEINGFLNEAYGINELPESSYNNWILFNEMRTQFSEDKKARVFTCLGHGGSIYAFQHLGTKKEDGGKTKVLLALYSDFSYINLSLLIELTYDENKGFKFPKLISVNTIYDSGYPPVCVIM